MANAVEEIFVSSGIVYVAGIEFPVNDINVSYGVGMIPQATFTVPGDTELERLGAEDKLPVAIFYLDQWYSSSGKEKDIVPTYCLLFDGEITGWNFRKSTDGRSIVFTATHVIGVLSQMFGKFLLGDATSHTQNSLLGLGNVQAWTIPQPRSFPYSLFQKGIFSGGAAKQIDRPFDFIENLLLPMRLGGYPEFDTSSSKGQEVAVNRDGDTTKSLNDAFIAAEKLQRIPTNYYDKYTRSTVHQSAPMDFFVKHNHKVKFDQRWIATTLERFYDADRFTQSDNIEDPRFRQVMALVHQKNLRNNLDNLFGEGGSFYDMLQIFYSSVVYEILMLPTAQYVLVGGRSNKQQRGIPLDSSGGTSTSEYRLGNYISKPQAHYALPPACNIIFPSMAPGFTYGENYAQQVTRVVSGSPFLDYTASKVKSPGAEFTRKLATTNSWPLVLKDIMEKETVGNVNNALLYPEEYFKGPVINQITMPAWYVTIKESLGDHDNSNKDALAENNRKASRGDRKEEVDKKADKNVTNDENIMSEEKLANQKSLLNASIDIRDPNSIYTRYTRLKYYENRFSTRNGSQDGMPFNPYIVPGQSFVYVGEEDGTFAFTGYVTNVSQHISSQGGMSTSLAYSFGRTLKENYEIAIQESIDTVERNKKKNISPALPRFHATAPIMPVQKLADELQETTSAGKYFRNLFYQGANARKSTVFDYAKFFNTSNYEGQRIPTANKLPEDPSSGYEIKLTKTRELDSQRASYNKAMQYVSRPVCTLDEYIKFINGGVGVDYHKINMMPADKYGISVPVVIREYLAEAKGTDPENSLVNKYITPTLTPTAEIYDMRRDWVAKIKEYRRKVHNKEIQR